MSKEYKIQDTSVAFALLIIESYRFLVDKKQEYVLSKQLLRSWTSIGANIKEACQWSSKKDFLYKMNIALKESHETEYRITLLVKSKYFEQFNRLEELVAQSNEMSMVLTRIVKTTKKSLEERFS